MITLAVLDGSVALIASSSSDSGSTKQITVGKYDQTWQSSLGNTSCTQWLHTMTDQWRFVASHQKIIALNAKDTSDAYARSFVADIDKDCDVGPNLTVADVAAAIATIATGDFN